MGKKKAWVFFWDLKKRIETQDSRYALGDVPVVVYKATGEPAFVAVILNPAACGPECK